MLLGLRQCLQHWFGCWFGSLAAAVEWWCGCNDDLVVYYLWLTSLVVDSSDVAMVATALVVVFVRLTGLVVGSLSVAVVETASVIFVVVMVGRLLCRLVGC
mmetsp:Transcript_12383/g.16250  ORF Transcript_12383/g.16250 Transcript_12383/m.16250 type:complete len:101 (+) Transcript_12383:530-832(+)